MVKPRIACAVKQKNMSPIDGVSKLSLESKHHHTESILATINDVLRPLRTERRQKAL